MLIYGDKFEARKILEQLEEILSQVTPEDIAPKLPANVSSVAYLESKRNRIEKLKRRIEVYDPNQIAVPIQLVRLDI